MGCRKTSLQIGQINYWLRLAKRSMEGMSFINFGSTMSLKILIVRVSGVCSSELGFLDGLPLPMVVFFSFFHLFSLRRRRCKQDRAECVLSIAQVVSSNGTRCS